MTTSYGEFAEPGAADVATSVAVDAALRHEKNMRRRRTTVRVLLLLLLILLMLGIRLLPIDWNLFTSLTSGGPGELVRDKARVVRALTVVVRTAVRVQVRVRPLTTRAEKAAVGQVASLPLQEPMAHRVPQVLPAQLELMAPQVRMVPQARTVKTATTSVFPLGKGKSMSGRVTPT